VLVTDYDTNHTVDIQWATVSLTEHVFDIEYFESHRTRAVTYHSCAPAHRFAGMKSAEYENGFELSPVVI